MTSTEDENTRNRNDELMVQIRQELRRLEAHDVRVSLDDEFEPKAGVLLRVEFGGAFWHIVPEEFHEIVSAVPNKAKGEAVKQAIERNAYRVWHGPSPPGSRDVH